MPYGTRRVVVENVRPEIDGGRFPVKRTAGEKVEVTADIFADGHDRIQTRLLHRRDGAGQWETVPMASEGNDRWKGSFVVDAPGRWLYTLRAWVDHWGTWREGARKKYEAAQPIDMDLKAGVELVKEAAARAEETHRSRLLDLARGMEEAETVAAALAAGLDPELAELMALYPDPSGVSTYDKELAVTVERERARFGAWYERFPRSCSPDPSRPGTLRDCTALLPEIARMGFDVFYLPPIHPIGESHRKGKNNAPAAGPEDPGSPWAIGSSAGGHKAVHPQLGTLEDFDELVAEARRLGLEVAMDLAFQCSPDHPYVKERPEWFRRRPDGSIQYAENPPKKYEDIYPLHFESPAWKELWEELESVVEFWMARGIRIFRVDNPHTKPFAFWEWLIAEARTRDPEVVFLSEAFTRPRVVERLAKAGFSQSYTYFTWRNTKRELTEYLEELTRTERGEYLRPNFWPNTPDILPEHLQVGGRPAFVMRLILAATLSSSYGIYGPPFELCASEALEGREEYLDSEKYRIAHWDWDRPGNLKDFIARLNGVRRSSPALHHTRNLRFLEVDNEALLAYEKTDPGGSEILLAVVSLDPHHVQRGRVRVPLDRYGIAPDQAYMVHDLLSEDKFIWQGEANTVELDPRVLPGRVFRLKTRMRRETDFDYFL